MTSGQRSVLTWIVLILLAAYLMGINVGSLVTSIIHAAQAMHSQNAHP